jgi:hypothetical protein
MLKADWFNLPLERELTLHKINQEVDDCTDIKALRESVKSLAYQNARFQHIIGELLKENMAVEIKRFFDEAKIEETTKE